MAALQRRPDSGAVCPNSKECQGRPADHVALEIQDIVVRGVRCEEALRGRRGLEGALRRTSLAAISGPNLIVKQRTAS